MRNAPATVAAGLGLALCALVPFVLVCCGGPRPDVSATNPPPSASLPSVASSEASQPAQPAQPAKPSQPSQPTASVPAAASEPQPYVQPPLPPYTGPVPTTCAELDRAITSTFKDLSCKSAEDCTLGARPCWCASALAMSAAPRLEAMNAAFAKKDCFHQLPPRPCPSCRTPLSVACTDGRCAPTFRQSR